MGHEDCVLCELEAFLKARGGELRRILQYMNPNMGSEYEVLFDELIVVDTERRMLRGNALR